MERHFCYSQHLTYLHPCYLGCTLNEVCGLTLLALGYNLVVSILLACYWHHFLLNFLGFFLVLYPCVRFLAIRLGKLKQDRPPRYLYLRAYQWVNQHSTITTPFIYRAGVWSVRRSV